MTTTNTISFYQSASCDRKKLFEPLRWELTLVERTSPRTIRRQYRRMLANGVPPSAARYVLITIANEVDPNALRIVR